MRISQLFEHYALIDETEVPFRVIRHGDKYTGYLTRLTYRSTITNDHRVEYSIDELMVDDEPYKAKSDREYNILKNLIVASLR